MVEMVFEKEWPVNYAGEYIGGWQNVYPLIPNDFICHWFYHVHYFTCYCGGKTFTYIKEDQEELTRGDGMWYGFSDFGHRWCA